MGTPVRINNVVMAFGHLWEKHAPPGTDRYQYSGEFILDPQKNAADIQAIYDAYCKELTGANKANMIGTARSPLLSGDQMNQEAQAKMKNPRPELTGKWVIRPTDSRNAPSVVNARMEPLTAVNSDQLFSGCIVNVFMDIYWLTKPNPGVYAGLIGVQLVDNQNTVAISGGGRVPVNQMFEIIPGAPAPQQPVTGVPVAPGSPAAPAVPGAPTEEKPPWL